MVNKQGMIHDLKTLVLCSGVVLCTWFLFLDWTYFDFVSSNDAISFYLILQKLNDVGGTWKNLYTDLSLFGGFSIFENIGMPYICEWLTYLPVGPKVQFNFFVFHIQILFGFLGLRTMEELSALWSERESSQSCNSSQFFQSFQPLSILISKIGLVWLISFSPLIGWRVSFGHIFFLLGFFPFLVAGVLILTIGRKTLSPLLFAIALWALINSWPTNGQQIIYYSASLNFPILLGYFLEVKQRKGNSLQDFWRTFFWVSAIFIVSIFLAWPKYSEMLSYAFSGDTARGIETKNVLYSYTTAELSDWWGSLFWTKSLIPNTRASYLLHETNYPITLFLPLFFLFTPEQRKRWKIPLLLSLLFILILSMNLQPFSQILVEAMPFMNIFRVPARSIFPWAFTGILLFGSTILYWIKQIPTSHAEDHKAHKDHIRDLVSLRKKLNQLNWKNKTTYFLMATLFLFFAIMFAPGVLRELITTTLFIISILCVRRKNYLPLTAIVFLLGFGSLQAFKERLNPFANPDLAMIKASLIKDKIELKYGRQDAPFERSILAFDDVSGNAADFSFNKAMAIGINSFEGGLLPPRRLINLLQGLGSNQVNATTMLIAVYPPSEFFPYMQALYNIKSLFSFREENGERMIVRNSFPTPLGQAWFAKEITFSENYGRLGKTFRDNIIGLEKLLREKVFVISSEMGNLPSASQEKLTHYLPQVSCQESRVFNINREKAPQLASLTVRSEGDFCPLIVSLNYKNRIRVSIKTGDDLTPSVPLIIFPANGPLLGVLVPRGEHTLVIESGPKDSLMVKVVFGLGVVLFLGLLYATFKGSLLTKNFINFKKT